MDIVHNYDYLLMSLFVILAIVDNLSSMSHVGGRDYGQA